MTREDGSTGLVLFAHGSRVEEANRGVRDLARAVQSVGPYHFVCAAFLELAQPNLAAAVRQAVEAGVRHIIVIPYFLTTGVHLRRDLPKLMGAEKQKYPEIEIAVAPPLEGHPLMASLVLSRAREATGKTKAAP